MKNISLLFAALPLFVSAEALERKLTLESVGEVTLAAAEPGPWSFTWSAAKGIDGTDEITVTLSAPAPTNAPKFNIGFSVPQLGHDHFWEQGADWYGLPPDWACWRASELAQKLPLYCYFDSQDRAHLTLAASEAARFTEFRGGLNEEECAIKANLEFLTQKEAPLSAYSVKLRIDARKRPFASAVRDGADWIFAEIGGRDDAVPEDAFAPLYSTWYQFHQNLFAADIEAECALAAKAGMKVIIVDDGWQTDDNSRGYAFCGDWEVSTNRFPDIRAHVERVHQLGMKYMMWFSVPFVGKNSRFAYERFKGMLLDDHGDGTCVLDPRYPEVRNYLVGVYERAIRDWGLDGVKLDFIDQFNSSLFGKNPKLLEPDPRRDTDSMCVAVDRLLKEVTARLKALKPDVLIEFRQNYIGPVVRKFGNMLRAGDCPGDRTVNRSRIAALRLTSGTKAVHADMLEWNKTDTAEHAALAVMSALFGVVQYSMMLREIPPAHNEMIRAWIAFSQAHKEALLKGAFRPHYPNLSYPLIEGESAKERIVGVYSPGFIAPSGEADRTVIFLNATGEKELVVDLAAKPKAIRVFDTFGKEAAAPEALVKGINRVKLPLSGRLELDF